jgi:hypothetical protein
MLAAGKVREQHLPSAKDADCPGNGEAISFE